MLQALFGIYRGILGRTLVSAPKGERGRVLLGLTGFRCSSFAKVLKTLFVSYWFLYISDFCVCSYLLSLVCVDKFGYAYLNS
jgi:hypothetical protein